MAFFEVERSLGTLRSSFNSRFVLSDLARLANSMAISFAFGSFEFCIGNRQS